MNTYNVFTTSTISAHDKSSYTNNSSQNFYTLALAEIENLVELDNIHRENLIYLETLAAKYTVDTPLKVLNEIKEEKKELRKIKIEINNKKTEIRNIESINKDKSWLSIFSEWIKNRELRAAKSQLESKISQVEIHARNIKYLSNLNKKRSGSVSIYNAIRDEAKELILLRKNIAKLDWRLLQLTQEKAPAFSLNAQKLKRTNHSELIYSLYNNNFQHNSTILNIIGEVVVEQDIVCLVNWEIGKGIFTQKVAGDLMINFLAFILVVTKQIPSILYILDNQKKIYMYIGNALLKQPMGYYSDTEQALLFDYEFSYQHDLAFLNIRNKDILKLLGEKTKEETIKQIKEKSAFVNITQILSREIEEVRLVDESGQEQIMLIPKSIIPTIYSIPVELQAVATKPASKQKTKNKKKK